MQSVLILITQKGRAINKSESYQTCWHTRTKMNKKHKVLNRKDGGQNKEHAVM